MIKNIITAALLTLPSLLWAQGFQVNLQGQKQISMAGAGTGVALDEASIFFNPGAVSMLKDNGVMGGISPVFFRSAFQQSGSFTTEYNKKEVAPPFQAYGVWGPKSGKYKLGLGVYTPFGGLNNWGPDWSGKYSVTLLDLKAIYVQPTVSVQLTDHLGIGAGFVYNHGSVTLKKRIPVANDQGQPGTASLEGNGDGYGWNAGIFYKTDIGLSIGASYRSKVNTKLEDGDADFDIASSLPYTNHTTFSAELPLPATASIGFGYQINPKTLLLLDGNLVFWHVYKSLDFYYDEPTIGGTSTKSERNYKDAGTIRLGAQHQYNDKLALRAGVGYAFTPVKEGYVTPEVPDANRIILSAGAGYKISNKFQVDASVLYEGLEERTETNKETQLSGTFKSSVFSPGISLSYKF